MELSCRRIICSPLGSCALLEAQTQENQYPIRISAIPSTGSRMVRVDHTETAQAGLRVGYAGARKRPSHFDSN